MERHFSGAERHLPACRDQPVYQHGVGHAICVERDRVADMLPVVVMLIGDAYDDSASTYLSALAVVRRVCKDNAVAELKGHGSEAKPVSSRCEERHIAGVRA